MKNTIPYFHCKGALYDCYWHRHFTDQWIEDNNRLLQAIKNIALRYVETKYKKRRINDRLHQTTWKNTLQSHDTRVYRDFSANSDHYLGPSEFYYSIKVLKIIKKIKKHQKNKNTEKS